MPSNTYTEFFIMCNRTDVIFYLFFQIGLISLMSPLPVTKVETPYFLAMIVYDSCFNTASVVVNITTFSEVYGWKLYCIISFSFKYLCLIKFYGFNWCKHLFHAPKPPTFQNLPTEVELGDDVTEETLLIVVNVTDPNSDSFSCVQTSVLPDTTYFRLVDYTNGSKCCFA